MRARQRHFNPRDAGANLVYDSRRISGLSNNDPVSTWPDISRNAYDATGTSTARPLYITQVQGGNPALRFDGSNDQLSIPSGPSLSTTAGFNVQVVIKQTAFNTQYPNILDFKTNETNNWVFGFSNQPAYQWILMGSDGNFARLRWNTTANTNTNILNVKYNGSGSSTAANWNLIFNGLSQTLTSADAFAPNSSGAGIGAEQNNNWNNADYYHISLINAEASESLRKRLNHASAYSFKIACS